MEMLKIRMQEQAKIADVAQRKSFMQVVRGILSSGIRGVYEGAGATLLRGLSDFVCINVETGKATRMPPEFIETYRLTATVDGDN